MKLIDIFCAVLLASSIEAYASNAIVANTLFGGIPTNNNYNNWGATPSNNGCDGYQGGHSGIDIQSQARGAETFFSTVSGQVISTNASNANGIAIYNANDDVTAIYLHASSVLVNVGDSVNVGTPIGRQGCVGHCFGPHVHLEYRTGRKTSGACGKAGTLDPVATSLKYINSATPSSSASLPPRFDGMGSLVDPIAVTGCTDGCNQDQILLHSHADSNQKSVGMFQVYKIEGVCSSVELTGLRDANVEVRPWWGRNGTNSAYYNVKSMPAVIPLSNDLWSLISVTTTAPIETGGTRKLVAKCLPSVPNPYDANVEKKSSGTPLAFDGGYLWGGNGSLISFSRNQNSSVTGRTYDVAVFGKNTLSAFQIHSIECPKINIESTDGQQFKISRKLWNAKDWIDDNNFYTDVSHTFDSSDWWIIKIKADKTGVDDSHVSITCVQ
jgi:hypothetical protein